MGFGDMTEEERKAVIEKAKADFLVREEKFLQTAKGHVKAKYNCVPKRLRKKWLDAYDGKLSRLKSIHLFCAECFGYSDVEKIKDCPARGCPLWNMRPGANK